MITKQNVLSALKEEERSGMNYEELCSALGVESEEEDRGVKVALLEALICRDVISFYFDGPGPDVIFQVRIVECESCGFETERDELYNCDETGEEVCSHCVVICEDCGAHLLPDTEHINEDGFELCSFCIEHCDDLGGDEFE